MPRGSRGIAQAEGQALPLRDLLNAHQKQVLKMWSASILWMVVIAIESTNWLSAANTSRILYPIFHFFTGVDPVRFVVWDYYIRKVGHFCGYFRPELPALRLVEGNASPTCKVVAAMGGDRILHDRFRGQPG